MSLVGGRGVEALERAWEWVSDVHEGQLQRLARRGERDGSPH
ncbi:hypothetical protein [Nonomuraea montanisoli]|nr:hypothetical protein [Nonomuraea montanisoli]